MQPIAKYLLPRLLSVVIMAFSVIWSPAVMAAPNWGYDGDLDPNHWSALQSEFALCGAGQSQSPIDLISEGAVDGTDLLNVDYHPAPLDEVNTGLTLQMNYAHGSTVTIDDQDYELVQFHFHTPSEHLMDHNSREMELHLVHKNTDDQLAVVGVMIEPGAKNQALEEILSNTPAGPGQEKVTDLPVDASQLLPRDRSFYHYQGSLTTPPCSESVNWVVMKEPIQASTQQIDAFKSRFRANARPVQDLHHRPVSFSHS